MRAGNDMRKFRYGITDMVFKCTKKKGKHVKERRSSIACGDPLLKENMIYFVVMMRSELMNDVTAFKQIQKYSLRLGTKMKM